jgi:hypothetical protein
MSNPNQPPPQAVANLPIGETVLGAFASVAGQLGLVARAAKGAFLLLVMASLISLALPAGGSSSLFLVLVSFAATCHFGVNWCRVMLLGPAGLPARALSWREPHWRFFGHGLLLFFVMMLLTLPMTFIGSVLAGLLGLAGTADSGPGLGVALVLLLVFVGSLYVLARLGFIFPAIAVEESYDLRLAWQHTAGQGARITAALFAAGLPVVLAQLALTAFLFDSLFGISITQMLPAPGGELPTTAPPPSDSLPQEAPSVFAVLLFDLVAAVTNFLSFAVLFSLLCLAFRTCTGWVPAGPASLPAAPRDEDRDGSNAGF